MDEAYPTRRPMGEFRADVRDGAPGFSADFRPEDALLPWIDIHGHHHNLTWNELEKFALTGCSAVVMAVGNIGSSSPYRPMSAEDVRTQWDRLIRFSHNLSRSFPYEAYVALGVHTTNGPVDRADLLIDMIPEYAALDEVIALSETGITAVQENEALSISKQRSLIEAQLRMAGEADIPAVLHTPTIGKSDSDYVTKSTETHNTGEPVLDSDSPKLDGTQINVEVADEAGFPEDRLVLTHAHRTTAPWILENTDCYASFTVGNATRDVSPDDVRSAIETYGPDRIMIDTDSAAIYDVDPFAVKRTMFHLLRSGIDREDVRRIVFENQRELLGLDHL